MSVLNVTYKDAVGGSASKSEMKIYCDEDSFKIIQNQFYSSVFTNI